ncbi:MAG: DUF4270 domain-containing protein [Bacteroidia bacterium]|nr:DUF4270 domain-containing protein [Bacteroidia bacterium]
MMNYWKDKIKPVYLPVLFAFILSSCKKDPGNVGSDVIGNRAGYNIQVTDTFNVVAYSVPSDSVDTRGLTYYMLGSMHDPVLGVTTANIITQFALPVAGFSFNGNTIDSVVLQLRYAGKDGIYGNNTNQSIQVYELQEGLSESLSEPIFSNKNYQIGSNVLGSYNGVFATADSVVYSLNGKTISNAPQIRIRINDADFINRLQTASATTFASNANFKAAFKGFFISAEQPGISSGNGAITFINMRRDNPQTALVVYFKENGVPVKYEFPIQNSSEVKANQYKHSNRISFPQPSHQQTCYVQAAAGIKTRILIPGLLELAKNENIGIISARLEVKLKDSASIGKYTIPTQLYAFGNDSLGRNTLTRDLQQEFLSYLGGNYDASVKGYWFNLNREIQHWLTTYRTTGVNLNTGFNITIPADNPISASRLILDTDRSIKGEEKVKLILTYTVIK